MDNWIDQNRDQLEKLALVLGILYLTIRLLKVRNLWNIVKWNIIKAKV